MTKDLAFLMEEIKRRARVFAEDNFHHHQQRDCLVIENAMLVGANVALEIEKAKIKKETDQLAAEFDAS